MTHSDGSDGPGGPDRDQSELHEDDAWWLRERQRHETPEAPEEVAEPAAVVPTPPEPEPEPIGVEALAPVAPLFLDDMAEDSGDDYSGVYTAAPYEGLGEGVAEAEERQELDEPDSFWAVPTGAAAASMWPEDDEVIDVPPETSDDGDGDGGSGRGRRIALAGVLGGLALIVLLILLLSGGSDDTEVRAAQPKRTTTTERRATTTSGVTTTTLGTTTTEEPTTAVPPTIIPGSIAPHIVVTTRPSATNPPQTDPPPTDPPATTQPPPPTTQPPPPPPPDPPGAFFGVAPSSVTEGAFNVGDVTLSWATSGADTATISGSTEGTLSSALSGSLNLCPTGETSGPCLATAGTYTYTIDLVGPGGSNQYQATLTINPAGP